MSLPHLSRSTFLSCSLADEGVFMHLSDGPVRFVDHGKVARSELLTEYLNSAGGNEVIIPVSEELFHAWLKIVEVLEQGEDVVSARVSSLQNAEVLLYLQAADFFLDSAAARALAGTAAERLFACPTSGEKHELDIEAMLEVLENLTTDTVIAILKVVEVSLEGQLASLPQTLHTLAIHASFPSLRSEGSLDIHCGGFSESTVTQVLRTFNAVTHSRSLPINRKTLSISNVHLRSSSQPDELLQTLGHAIGTSALGVSISEFSLDQLQMQQLLTDIGRNSELRSLQLTALTIVGQDESEIHGSIPAFLSDLRNLEHLQLKRNCFQVDLNLLSQVGRLTSLTHVCIQEFNTDVYSLPYELYSTLLVLPLLQSVSLPLVLRKQDDAVAAATVCHLQHLSSLSLLEAKSKQFPGQEEVSAIHMKSLMRELAQLTQLRTLDVSSYSFRWRTWRQGREGERLLSAAVKCMPFLQEAALSVCRISDETLAIAESLLVTKSCQQLRFRSHSCRPVAKLRQLVTLFSKLPDLTDLALDVKSSKLQSCRTWRTAGHADLRLVLEHEDTVDMHPEPLGGVSRLFIGDGAHCCSGVYPGAYLDVFEPALLQNLHVNGYHIHDWPGTEFVDGLAMQKNLTTLHMSQCSFSSQLSKFLARTISDLESLQELRIDLHSHCGNVAPEFYDSLQHMPQLTALELSVDSEDVERPTWSETEATALASALKQMPGLRKLTFDGWHFNRDIMGRLAQALMTLTSIQNFTLSNSRKSATFDLGIAHEFPSELFATILTKFRILSTLKLNSLGLDQSGVTRILRSLAGARNLERLQMEATLDTDGAEALLGLLHAVPCLRDVEQLGADVESALTIMQYILHMDPMRCFQLAERCMSASGA